MIELASILLLGIAAQWLAWRLRLPSILLLLLVGFAAGPLSGHRFLDPDALFGRSLLPFVSLAVAAILLEGGMSLRFRELGAAASAVRNLILIGSPLTWLLAASAAHWVLGMSWHPSLLLGAILVVTGPTVIVPLLRHVRPSGAVGSIVRWEGIVGDPIGAILAVLVFQAMSHAAAHSQTSMMVLGLLKAALVGAAGGAAGAGLLILLLHKKLVPDYLQSPVALAIGIAAFLLPNLVQHESGLLAVTLMGVILANQRLVVVEHIVEFKENLRVLLISSLFILLAARLPADQLQSFDLSSLLFVLALILVVRPLAVFLATLGTGLKLAERTFIAWMAPRGIVAAAVASVFALELPGAQGDRLVSVVYLVIVCTAAVYGLTARPLARWLGLAASDPQGVLFVGAHRWARAIAKALQDEGIPVLLVDTSWGKVSAARMQGLPVHLGSVLSESFEHSAPLDGIGKLLCLTYNDQVNSLACLRLSSWFERSSIYQLPAENTNGARGSEAAPQHMRGRALFSADASYWDYEERFRHGAVVKRTGLSEEFDLDDFRAIHEREDAPVIPLFAIRDGRLLVAEAKEELACKPGDTLVALVDPEEEVEAQPLSGRNT